MKILFRTDASLDIGTGHVMRCLTLADGLRLRGASSRFLCRAHRGHLADMIRNRGHELILLPRDGVVGDDGDLAHASWLGAGQEADADASLAVARETPPDWLVVDHYGIDARWHRRLRPAAGRIMVIDDLRDRRHDCDLLLDQNLGRAPDDYASLVPDGTPVLAGTCYALLRREFAEWRKASLQRREAPAMRDILINLGGVDNQDATSLALAAIGRAGLPGGWQLTVVMGEQAPWFDKVERAARALPEGVRLLKGVTDIARLMASADLAIGAAGSTAWERCALGLPTILIVLADNQRDIAARLVGAGAALSAGAVGAVDCEDRLIGAIERLGGDAALRHEMAHRAASLVDGAGVDRVAGAMLDPGKPL